MLLLVTSACSSTLTIGPKANSSQLVGVKGDLNGVGVTLPLVKLNVDASK